MVSSTKSDITRIYQLFDQKHLKYIDVREQNVSIDYYSLDDLNICFS